MPWRDARDDDESMPVAGSARSDQARGRSSDVQLIGELCGYARGLSVGELGEHGIRRALTLTQRELVDRAEPEELAELMAVDAHDREVVRHGLSLIHI